MMRTKRSVERLAGHAKRDRTQGPDSIRSHRCSRAMAGGIDYLQKASEERESEMWLTVRGGRIVISSNT